jgi:hypothetical protein
MNVEGLLRPSETLHINEFVSHIHDEHASVPYNWDNGPTELMDAIRSNSFDAFLVQGFNCQAWNTLYTYYQTNMWLPHEIKSEEIYDCYEDIYCPISVDDIPQLLDVYLYRPRGNSDNKSLHIAQFTGLYHPKNGHPLCTHMYRNSVLEGIDLWSTKKLNSYYYWEAQYARRLNWEKFLEIQNA